jgi:hypothetical protein
MMLQALAIERAAAARTAERVLHHHIAQYQVPATHPFRLGRNVPPRKFVQLLGIGDELLGIDH